MMQKLIVALVLLASVAGANYAAYRSLLNPEASAAWDTSAASGVSLPDDGIPALPWTLLEQTAVDAQTKQIRFPAELKALDGMRVRLAGVAVVLDNLVVEGKVPAFILMPPSMISCCGITCDPRAELMVYVDCNEHPFPRPAKKGMAVIIGRLELAVDDSSWSLYTLSSAEVRLSDDSK